MQPEYKNKMKSIYWHIERYDRLRTSTANRAAMVLSANALLFAGTIFLIDKGLTKPKPLIFQILLIILIIASFLLIAGSIFFSMSALILSWRTSREMWEHIPKRIFFQARDTIDKFGENFEHFKNYFNDIGDAEIINYGLAELWTCIKQHFHRYQKLRKAIRLLYFSIGTYLLSIIIILINIIYNYYLSSVGRTLPTTF